MLAARFLKRQLTARKIVERDLPQATFEWYAENYLDHYYPIRYLIRFNGIRLPEAPR